MSRSAKIDEKAPETEKTADLELHVYDRFKAALFECLDYRKVDSAVSLHRVLSFVEKSVKVLCNDNYLYRTLVVYKALMDCVDKPNTFELEYLRIHLADGITDETAQNLAKAVCCVRAIVGMKHLHENIVNAWREAVLDPNSYNDPDYYRCQLRRKKPDADVSEFELPFLDGKSQRVVNDASAELETPISVFGEHPLDAFPFKGERVYWKNAVIEKMDYEDGDELLPGPSSAQPEQPNGSNVDDGFNYQTLMAYISELPEANSVLLRLSKILSSPASNDEIQFELVDLLGLDFFDLLAQILENRQKLAEDLATHIAKVKKLERTIVAPAAVDLGDERYAGSVVVQTKRDAQLQKQIRKEEKKSQKALSKIVLGMGAEERMDLELARAEQQRKRRQELAEAAQAGVPFDSRIMLRQSKKLPYVFDAYDSTQMKDFELAGVRCALPEGSEMKITTRYREVTVPPQEPSKSMNIHHVLVDTLDPLGKLAFTGFEKLNAIQSIVFEQAYNSMENLLICAPTGAGKTNIALLAALKTIRDHCDETGKILKDQFKIIYIAPMKALATEMTRSFSKRLSHLGLIVRELTGDTQLSRKEISETQMLVLTPEKWDVVTRKVDDEGLTQLVKLIIIDEVHLLHDERGPVIETIVTRALRQMEYYQQHVRIVGLSATLPNYIDVAKFLCVDPEKGLFYFDGRFRPVPLTQTFVGVITPNSGILNRYMDEACYDKLIEFLREDHQVLIFVHSRNATVMLAQFLLERAALDGDFELFLPSNITTADYKAALKKSRSLRSNDLKALFERGVGIHNAGLIRADRLMMEKFFGDGHIKVMCCTATLAWGVNLPAHAVIIRGTDVFDANRGAMTDLGVLDVQQIFGRAGRPQFETSGHGVIITPYAKLSKYVGMLIRQAPIESRFQSRIHDNLNAEIARGTVTTLSEAVEWLRYSYFYVRAKLNPMVYGINYGEVRRDPTLSEYLQDLCYSAAQKLDSNQMIRFDSINNFLSSTDLGRIASHFYITTESIERFTTGEIKLTPNMTDDKILALICLSSEFNQIQARENEMVDLDMLASTGCALPIRGGGLASTPGKVNCLLQTHISRAYVHNFTLASEMVYVSQNASRISRALFEITIRKGWAATAVQFLQMSKYIQKRLWNYNSPLKQVSDANLLKEEIVKKVEARRYRFFELCDYSASELADLFRCDGPLLYNSIRMVPSLEAEATIRPVTATIVRIDATLTPAFTWSDALLGAGGSQRFWLIIEDTDTNFILHYEQVMFARKKVQTGDSQHFTVTIPIEDSQIRDRFQLRVVSDDWVVEDTVVPLCLNNYTLPESIKPHTDLLDLEPLPISALKNPGYESLYSFEFFNPVQTQVFFSLYHTWDNVLIGAPTSSGKTLCAELAIFRLLQHRPNKKCVYIAPLKALVRERVLDWTQKFVKKLGIGIVELSGDTTPQLHVLEAASILVTTPEKWDGITRSYDTRSYARDVDLVIVDEIHLLGVERGAVLEAIVTRLKFMARRRAKLNPVRIIGLSTALANALEIADWLGVPESGLFNFRPSVRPVPIEVHIQGFAGQHYCPRMALMNKPAFKSILQFSPTKPVLVFVASRRQTRLTAMAFVSMLAQQPNPKQWLHMETSELTEIVQTIRDENLRITLPFGIGMHHAGLQSYERGIVERLFVEKKIQVLIATATLAWGINVPAHLVIVKGTEYYDGKTHKYVDFPVTDVLQMIGRAGRPQYDTSAVAVVYVQDIKKRFYKRFLYEPFPVESSLLPVLPNHVNAEICSGAIQSKQQIIDYLAGTYLYRRLFANPSYYDIEEFTDENLLEFLNSIVDECVAELVEANCVMFNEEEKCIQCTPFGTLASKYYLEHRTIGHFAAELGPEFDVVQLLRVLTDCPEYAEIPVRHNEDLINQDLNKISRYPFEKTADFESPHIKSNLLYQAFFSRTAVPVDYMTDQRSIVESCIRIVQSILDFCVLKGWLQSALTASLLLQQIIQVRWYDDHPLMCIPHLEANTIDALGVELTIPQLQENLGIRQITNDVLPRDRKRMETVLRDRSPLDEYEAKEVVTALLAYPVIRLADFQLQQHNLKCQLDPFTLFDNEKNSTPIPMNAGENYRLKVSFQNSGPGADRVNAFAPNYPKEKTASWILILGEAATNKVLACQKTSPISGRRPHSFHLNFKAPTECGKHHLTLYLLSDSYMGIDQEYEVLCDVANSVVS